MPSCDVSFAVSPKQAIDQTMKLAAISEVLTSMWRQHNANVNHIFSVTSMSYSELSTLDNEYVSFRAFH